MFQKVQHIGHAWPLAFGEQMQCQLEKQHVYFSSSLRGYHSLLRCKVSYNGLKKDCVSLLICVFSVILQTIMTKRPFLPTFIGTGFGTGFSPWAPGTAGALLATAMWYTAGMFVSGLALVYMTICSIVIFTALGTWATARLIPYWGNDPSRVVVDEMVGVWIPLIASPAVSVGYAMASFILFRFFDIVKPLGIRKLDQRKGAFWVMADDILAGFYSLVIIVIVRWVI